MPYQGAHGYVPPSGYTNYGSHSGFPGQAQTTQRQAPTPQGQAQVFQRQVQSNYPQQQQQQMNSGYGQLPLQQQPQAQNRPQPQANYSQPAYSTPQLYDQTQSQQPFYQSPSAQYQPSPRQPYLSPPITQTSFPANDQYSPDPLHYYQQPPIPASARGRVAQDYTAQRQQHSHQPQPQYQPRLQQRIHSTGGQQTSQTPQWPRQPAPVQTNTVSAASNVQLTQQNRQQQRTTSQHRSQSGAGVSPQIMQNQQQQRAHAGAGYAMPQSQQQRTQAQQRPGIPSAQPILSAQQRPLPPSQPQSRSGYISPGVVQRPASQVLSPPKAIKTEQEQQSYRQQGPILPPKAIKIEQEQQSSRQQATHAQPPTTIDPNLLQRKVVHVEIPVKRVEIKREEPPMGQFPKRRKSNEGHSLPVCDNIPVLPRPTGLLRAKNALPASSPLTDLASSQIPPSPPSANIDYQAVLLELSDEYISAAYSMSADLSSLDVSQSHLDQYYAMLSTGMGCLESVLKNHHILDPRKEARIRLRLASLLHDETENEPQAVEVLTKGLSICERARLLEHKYAMHHLLARIWFKGKKPKAAIKAIEKSIAEVEKLNLLHWVYAFRFLRISLGFRADKTTTAQATAMVKQLSAIADLAALHRHVEMQFVAATLEALIHLQTHAQDAVDSAQRALAAARMHQLSPEMAQMPQARLLADCVDLACSLARYSNNQARQKLATMQTNMDSLSQDSSWQKDGSWLVPTWAPPNHSDNIDIDSAGVLKNLDNGRYGLTFRWLTKSQVYTLGYLLSGLAGMLKNLGLDKKSESLLNDGYKLSKAVRSPVQQSMRAASSQSHYQNMTRIIIRLYAVFASCGRADWQSSLKGLKKIQEDVLNLEDKPDESVLSLAVYLEALAKHGLGDMTTALTLYRSQTLSMNFDDQSSMPPGGVNPIKLLAALNSVLALRSSGDDPAANMLLYNLQAYCVTGSLGTRNHHADKGIESIYFILKVTESPDELSENPILRMKKFLQSAVDAAKSTFNDQLLCVVVNMMTDIFFQNIVGDQAEKSCRAGKALAVKSQNPLWGAVANGMYTDLLERSGKKEEAEHARQEAQDSVQQLPDLVKAALYGDEMDES